MGGLWTQPSPGASQSGPGAAIVRARPRLSGRGAATRMGQRPRLRVEEGLDGQRLEVQHAELAKQVLHRVVDRGACVSAWGSGGEERLGSAVRVPAGQSERKSGGYAARGAPRWCWVRAWLGGARAEGANKPAGPARAPVHIQRRSESSSTHALHMPVVCALTL